MTQPSRDNLIIVALSGGVDSAVAAWLLQQQGHNVQGLHMTNWDDDEGYCDAADDLRSARRVAEQLDIVLHRVNFAEQYRQRVFSHFLREYAAGRTPNPDVLCNREIKFGDCLRHARRLGADFLATGHYARVLRSGTTTRLGLAADADKDQTYFLHAVHPEALAQVLFPLGALTKPEVRRAAREAGLGNWDRPDSTGICFIGERPFREFLGRHLPAQPGPIENESGEIIGHHQGLAYYTLGQRNGLGIGGVAGSDQAPWYVAAKRSADNTLVVVQGRDHPQLCTRSLIATQLHWINGEPAALAHGDSLALLARIRHRQTLQRCVVQRCGDQAISVAFEQPQRGVAPGQFAVFYDADVCLGGGVITLPEPT